MSRIYKFHNPVKKGLVFSAEDYIYYGARDYSGEKGMLENILLWPGSTHAKGFAK